MKVRIGLSLTAMLVLTGGCGEDGGSTPTPTPSATAAPLTVSPTTGDTTAFKDTLLRLTFDGPPVITGSGTIRVYRSDGTLVDTIDTSANIVTTGGETQSALGAANTEIDKIGNGVPSLTQYRYTYYRPLSVAGNVATIKLHDGVLAYDTAYYVQVDQSVFNGSFGGAGSFSGIGGATAWTFRTKSAPTSTTNLIVDDDGPADFRSLQGALDYVMATGCLSCPSAVSPKTITLKNGIYDEQLFLRNVSNLTILGETRAGTIVRNSNWEAFNPGTGGSRATPNTTFSNIGGAATLGTRLSLGGGRAVLLVEGGDLLKLSNFTFANTHVKDAAQNSQAEVIYYNSATLNGSRFIATDMNFLGTQDTLQMKGWVWIYNSLITGDVDFLWGYPFAEVIENSELRTVFDPTTPGSGGYLFQSRAAKGYPGFVVLGGALTAASGVPDGSAYLARSGGSTQAQGFCTTMLVLGGGLAGNATQYCDSVAYIGVKMGAHIAPAGWFINPVPNLLPTAREGWRESGSMTPGGATLPLSGRETRYASSTADLSSLNTRAKVFAQWNGNAGWNPQP